MNFTSNSLYVYKLLLLLVHTKLLLVKFIQGQNYKNRAKKSCYHCLQKMWAIWLIHKILRYLKVNIIKHMIVCPPLVLSQRRLKSLTPWLTSLTFMWIGGFASLEPSPIVTSTIFWFGLTIQHPRATDIAVIILSPETNKLFVSMSANKRVFIHVNTSLR